MAKTNPRVRIVWNSQGGELDSVTLDNRDDDSIRDAIIRLLGDGIVTPGDSITVQEVQS